MKSLCSTKFLGTLILSYENFSVDLERVAVLILLTANATKMEISCQQQKKLLAHFVLIYQRRLTASHMTY